MVMTMIEHNQAAAVDAPIATQFHIVRPRRRATEQRPWAATSGWSGCSLLRHRAPYESLTRYARLCRRNLDHSVTHGLQQSNRRRLISHVWRETMHGSLSQGRGRSCREPSPFALDRWYRWSPYSHFLHIQEHARRMGDFIS
jgi:hypothetical protein